MTAAGPISQAVLLVGGAGTRLRPLTYLMPKALLPVLNRPLISYELELLGRSGVPEVLLSTGSQVSQLRDVLGSGDSWGVHLTYVEEQRPLGTAGAIKNAQELLVGDFFVSCSPPVGSAGDNTAAPGGGYQPFWAGPAR